MTSFNHDEYVERQQGIIRLNEDDMEAFSDEDRLALLKRLEAFTKANPSWVGWCRVLVRPKDSRAFA